MSYRFCLAVLVGFMSYAAFGANAPQQVVTSEVFYDYTQENQINTDQSEMAVQQRYVNSNSYEPTNVGKQAVPVWPIAGTDADFKIACKDQECSDGELKIVSKIGSGLVIENNINMAGGTSGTGWSGGPDIYNGQQIPAGFDYECVNDAEMPLLQREMMEDDGGTVLSMSRSSRKLCNKQPDSYLAFAERAGFVAEKTPTNSVTVAQTIVGKDGKDVIINVNEDVDDQVPAVAENEVRSWVVTSGQTLQSVLKSWCDKEGWDLVWTSPREYPIEASAVFRGRFVDVASALIRNFERAVPAPYAKFYKGNRVLVISTVD